MLQTHSMKKTMSETEYQEQMHKLKKGAMQNSEDKYRVPDGELDQEDELDELMRGTASEINKLEDEVI